MAVNYIEGWMSADAPHHIMRGMRANGWLKDHAPELARLYGVPQRAEHHPEIDTGVHVELALEVAAELSPDPRVRFAVLVHDLGKGLTPPDEWPAHHGHEERGVAPALELGKRLGVPDEWLALGTLVARYHLHAHRALDVPPRTLVRFFRDAQLFDHPERVEPFLIACEADARGRGGRRSNAYPQGARLREAFGVTHAVEVEDPTRLHETRIRTLAKAL